MFSFGYNSFWNFMQGSPAVQELLNKSDLKVDDLLEEDGLLLELKTSNQKLLNFLLQEDNFKALIHYVIAVPDAKEAEIEENKKKCYKYPFVCADVLSSDNQAIVSEFFKTRQDLKEEKAGQKAEGSEDQDEVNTDFDSIDKDESTEASAEKSKEESKVAEEGEKSSPSDAQEYPYLDYLFTFLDTKEINLTSAGYFAKIVNNLFAKKQSALITYLYERRPDLLDNMANHVSSKSIAEFLAKVLTFESSYLPSTDDEVFNTKRNDVLQNIIKKLEPRDDIEEINNTAYLICEVLGKYNTMHCSQEILQNLLKKETIDAFFDILKTKDSTSCCAVALILGNIFAYYILVNTPKMQQNNDESGSPESNNQPNQLELGKDIPLVSAFIDNLGSILDYVVNTTGSSFSSQYGAEIVPFGSARLKLVELIIIAMKANNQQIYAKLIEHSFVKGLLSLFVRYEWNNMLHNQVEKIIYIILDSSSEDLKSHLLQDAGLLDFIASYANLEGYCMKGKHERKIRKGYLGQLTKIANRIVETKDPVVKNLADGNEKWKQFLEEELSEINKLNDTKLGGGDPRGSYDEEPQNDDNQKDDDEDNADNHNQNDDDDDERDDDDDKNRNDLGEGKHIIHIGSHHREGERGHHDDDEDEIEENISGDRETEYSFPIIIDETMKMEENFLDNEYMPNTIYKREGWHSADDILKEMLDL